VELTQDSKVFDMESKGCPVRDNMFIDLDCALPHVELYQLCNQKVKLCFKFILQVPDWCNLKNNVLSAVVPISGMNTFDFYFKGPKSL